MRLVICMYIHIDEMLKFDRIVVQSNRFNEINELVLWNDTSYKPNNDRKVAFIIHIYSISIKILSFICYTSIIPKLIIKW